MSKRKAIDAFFKPTAPKKPALGPLASARGNDAADAPASDRPPFAHATYPFPQPHLPPKISEGLAAVPAADGVTVRDRPRLDLLTFTPFLPRATADALFRWLRRALFFYRVKYHIQRGPIRSEVATPRFTTVFGVDATSAFAPPDAVVPGALVDASTGKPVPRDRYAAADPRPLPPALAELKALVEACTDATYNFCLVNYYAKGADSISWHSDDERFLGPDPAIASLSLGARRDFCLKPKPPRKTPAAVAAAEAPANGSMDGDGGGRAGAKQHDTIKMALSSGDMVLMRGPTQAAWLHSVPKRAGGGDADRGRINITFRRALTPAGTENYYRYNVGAGAPWRWDEAAGEMRPWNGTGAGPADA